MKRILAAGLAIVAASSLAWAANNYRQSTSGGTVTTFKSTDTAGVHVPHVNVDSALTDATGKTSTMATSAPTAATFSSILALSTTRKGCLIQNNSGTTGYVYFGTTGSATTGNSFQVSPGQTISCNSGPIVLTDNIAATCASGTCAFVISSQ